MHEISLKGHTWMRRKSELGPRWEEDYSSLYILLNLSNIREHIHKCINKVRDKNKTHEQAIPQNKYQRLIDHKRRIHFLTVSLIKKLQLRTSHGDNRYFHALFMSGNRKNNCGERFARVPSNRAYPIGQQYHSPASFLDTRTCVIENMHVQEWVLHHCNGKTLAASSMSTNKGMFK